MFLLVQYAMPFYIFLNRWNTHILPKSYHTIIPYISSYIYPIEHPTLYTTVPYHHTLYVTLNLPYRTHIYHHTTIYQRIPPWWYSLYTTVPYHHTPYITLNLPYRTPYLVYHPTIPSCPIFHPISIL